MRDKLTSSYLYVLDCIKYRKWLVKWGIIAMRIIKKS